MKKTVAVNPVLCKGCGSCMATCPKEGIYVAGFTLEQLGAQVDAALGPTLEPLELPQRGQEDVSFVHCLGQGSGGKKFMWDGAIYVTREDARQALEAYKSDGAEVHMSGRRQVPGLFVPSGHRGILPRLNQTEFMGLSSQGQGPGRRCRGSSAEACR